MDSLTQAALGASVSLAVIGRRASPGKTALIGAVLATLPDLDVFVRHGDAILNMVLHRAESHAIFFLTLLSLPAGLLAARLHGGRALRGRWLLAAWLALITHPLLDLMTVYGTQILRPFDDFPYAVSSVFIVDPLYTVPLLIGLAISIRRGTRRANDVALALATAYLALGFAIQQHVGEKARQALQHEGVAASRLLVTPTAFNSVLWRIVAVPDDGTTAAEVFLEGYYSLLDAPAAAGAPPLRLTRFARGAELIERWRQHPSAARVAAFSHGFYKMRQENGQVMITDLRMGQEPFYSFDFAIAPAQADPAAESRQPQAAQNFGRHAPLGEGLRWVFRRARGREDDKDSSPPQAY